jgi:hypothetical protein
MNPNEPYQSQPERKITTPNPRKPTTCKGAHFIYTEDVRRSNRLPPTNVYGVFRFPVEVRPGLSPLKSNIFAAG